MPVKESIKPKDPKDLRQKIVSTKPGQEKTILQDVQTHVSIGQKSPRIFADYVQLGKRGSASYQQTEEGTRDVELMASKCIIFLITGEFQVRGIDITTAGEGHIVEDESTIQLQPYTAVAIINQG